MMDTSEKLPYWELALKVGQLYNELGDLPRNIRFAKIMREFKIRSRDISRYLAIAGLPSDVVELMKPFEMRSTSVNEKLTEIIRSSANALKSGETSTLGQVLSMDKAEMLAREMQGYSVERIFEVAVLVMCNSRDKTLDLIDIAKRHHDKSIAEVYEYYGAIPKEFKLFVSFEPDLLRRIDEQCIKTRFDRHTQIVDLVEKGLRNDQILSFIDSNIEEFKDAYVKLCKNERTKQARLIGELLKQCNVKLPKINGVDKK